MKTHRWFLVGACLTTVACGSSAAPAHSTTSSDVAPAGRTLAEILADASRPEEERVRDRYRHPEETLDFFGVTPTSRVLELAPGKGWYTRILAEYLKPGGTLTLGFGDPATLEGYAADNARVLMGLLEANRERFCEVGRVDLDVNRSIQFGADGSQDVVLTFRNFHNWVQAGKENEVVAEAFRVLRPGGVLGVVDHRAAPGADRETMLRAGYVTEALVIETAERAGFRLAERSEINANPNDTKDYPEGVWSLPPSLRLGEVDRERYLAIGESDRMTLRFVKPD